MDDADPPRGPDRHERHDPRRSSHRARRHRHVWNSSANFDPRQFDDPARLRLDRTPNRHLSFAVGAHFCLGAQLARIELGALVGALVETADGIELTGEPKRLYSNFLSGFTRLPVRFEAAARDRQPSNQAEKEEVR